MFTIIIVKNYKKQQHTDLKMRRKAVGINALNIINIYPTSKPQVHCINLTEYLLTVRVGDK